MIWNYIKAEPFLKRYLPNIRNIRHKIRGKNGRGNPVGFSEQEKKEINAALEKMVKDVYL